MPELPEVETIVRQLRPQLIGRTVLDSHVRWARTIAAPSATQFRRQIRGQIILAVTRRAKFLHLQLSSSHVLIHLRMSGDLVVKPGTARAEKHDRLILLLSEVPQGASPLPGKIPQWSPPQTVSLVFNDTRKFGRVWLTDDASSVTGSLGPEPFSRAFTPKELYLRLHARSRRLKPLLLDQTFLAGLGNIYTDEALHLARLHPLKASNAVTRPQAARLHAAIRRILREGIRRNGASIDWVYRGGEFQNHFRVYDRAGKACPVCGTRIKRILVGQRGTHYCPRCQRV